MSMKFTSEIVTISGSVDEAVAGTMVEETIPLVLSPLDLEVAVIYAIDLDPSFPDNIQGTDTLVTGSVSSTSRATVGSISESNVLATGQQGIRSNAVSSVGFQQTHPESPDAMLDYIGIVATNNMFAQVVGVNNTGTKGLDYRIWMRRAKVDGATYAALTQSEVLSAGL